MQHYAALHHEVQGRVVGLVPAVCSETGALAVFYKETPTGNWAGIARDWRTPGESRGGRCKKKGEGEGGVATHWGDSARYCRQLTGGRCPKGGNVHVGRPLTGALHGFADSLARICFPPPAFSDNPPVIRQSVPSLHPVATNSPGIFLQVNNLIMDGCLFRLGGCNDIFVFPEGCDAALPPHGRRANPPGPIMF